MEPPRRIARTSALVAFAIVAGLALGVAIDVVRVGGPRIWLARHGIQPAYEALGRRVDLGGRALYLDCRGAGPPTVVLEAGMGSGAGSWGAVLPELAGVARVCAYDRANLGRSDLAGGRRTLVDAADDLARLLAAAGERPPFVLVGHSLGGAYIRVFAALHRPDVAGVVLLDPYAPDLFDRYVLPLLGGLRPDYERYAAGLVAQVEAVDGLDWTASASQLAAASIGGLPVEVLVAERYELRLDAATNAVIATAWRRAYESLSPGRVRYAYAIGSGHLVSLDRPDLVVDAVRRLLGAARTAAP